MTYFLVYDMNAPSSPQKKNWKLEFTFYVRHIVRTVSTACWAKAKVKSAWNSLVAEQLAGSVLSLVLLNGRVYMTH